MEMVNLIESPAFWGALTMYIGIGMFITIGWSLSIVSLE